MDTLHAPVRTARSPLTALRRLAGAALLLAATACVTSCGGGGASTLPGVRVTSPPAPPVTTPPLAAPSGFTITGAAAAPAYGGLDARMQSFMQQYGIRAGQLAVGKGSKVLFSHAYTNTTDPQYPITQPSSIMRVSSLSKAFVTAAITKLYAANALSPTTAVFPYLGITQPLLSSQTPDARANAITVQELLDHTAGLHDSGASAPEFTMWNIEVAAGTNGPLSSTQFSAYLYGQPLGSAPGTVVVYSNEGYYLLARVIEKATGQPYFSWVSANVLAPVGVTDAVITATAQNARRPNEAICEDPAAGRSVLTPQLNVNLPDCYGGITYYEIMDGALAVSVSAQSLVSFAGTYNSYGLGGRVPGFAREGSFVGSHAWMEALTDGTNFVFAFNTRVNPNGNQFDILPLVGYLETAL